MHWHGVALLELATQSERNNQDTWVVRIRPKLIPVRGKRSLF